MGSSPDFETQSSYSVTVNANDESLGAPGSIEASQSFTLAINDVNEAPTDIALSPSSVGGESVNRHDRRGAVRARSDDANETATFTLIDDAGGRFAIKGNKLDVAGVARLRERKSRTR